MLFILTYLLYNLLYKVTASPSPPIKRLFNPTCTPNIKTQTCILFAKKETLEIGNEVHKVGCVYPMVIWNDSFGPNSAWTSIKEFSMKYIALILVHFLAAMITPKDILRLSKRNLGIPKGGFRFGFDVIRVITIHRKSRFSET